MNLYKTPRSIVIGHMRNAFGRGPIAKEVRRRAISKETGERGGKLYTCAKCGKAFQPKEIQVDHIDEVIPVDKITDDLSLDEIWNRLNCKTHWKDSEVNFDNLQCLCKACHKEKTASERLIREKTRASRKKSDKDDVQKVRRKTNKKRAAKK